MLDAESANYLYAIPSVSQFSNQRMSVRNLIMQEVNCGTSSNRGHKRSGLPLGEAAIASSSALVKQWVMQIPAKIVQPAANQVAT